jgi:hypothetical protein
MAYTSEQHSQQAFFVLLDAAYNNILHKLQNGSEVEYSYVGRCPDMDPSRCTCPRFANVLRNGRIMRVIGGELRPVYRASEVLPESSYIDITLRR